MFPKSRELHHLIQGETPVRRFNESLTGAAFLFTLLGQHALRGSDEVPTVELPADWKKGDTYRIEYVKERIDTRAKKTATAKSTTLIDVEVKDRNDQGFLVVWTHGETRLEGDQARDARLQKLADLEKGLRVELQTDEKGVPEKIVNETEVRAFWDRLKAVVSSELQQKGAQKAVLEAHEELASPDLMLQSLLQAPQTYYFLCGSSLEKGKPSEYEDMLQNPFGGEPFPCKGAILLKEVDPSKGEACLEWSQKLDPGRTQAILKESLGRWAVKLGKPPPKDEEFENFEIDDRARYAIDVHTGLPKTVTHTRTAITGDLKRVDVRKFTRLRGAR